MGGSDLGYSRLNTWLEHYSEPESVLHAYAADEPPDAEVLNLAIA